jgi:hypothetical protein
MTESEFKDWKASPITKQVFTSIAKRIYDLQVDLGTSAGIDVREDAKKVGAIQAYTDLLEIEFEEESQE